MGSGEIRPRLPRGGAVVSRILTHHAWTPCFALIVRARAKETPGNGGSIRDSVRIWQLPPVGGTKRGDKPVYYTNGRRRRRRPKRSRLIIAPESDAPDAFGLMLEWGPRRRRKELPLCGAKTCAGTPCRYPAGWGTDHKGEGRCKLHSGRPPCRPLHRGYPGFAEFLESIRKAGR